jgi:tetratricopeptide (TPR) repeat protein
MSAKSGGRESLYRRAFDAWDAGQYAHALELSRELVGQFPDWDVPWLLQGIILYEMKRFDEGEQVLHETIRTVSPEGLGHAYAQLGHLHKQRGNYNEAEKWYRKAAELRTDDAAAEIFLGSVLFDRGDLAGAEEAYRRASRCSEGAFDEAWFNLGSVLRSQERYEEALTCFGKALQFTPDYREALLAKADVENALALLKEGL